MKPRSCAALALVAALVIVVAPLSCRQIVGIQNDPPQDLTTTACGLPFGTNACASCAAANCCSQSTACSADTDCSTYESCMGRCSGDPACRSQCTIADPVGDQTPVSPLSACLVSNCGTECGIPCGGVEAYITEPRNADACQKCLSGNPCQDALAWAGSVDGDAYWRCYLACRTPDCRAACMATHPDGGAQFSTFQNLDYPGTCSTDCQYGEYWPCIGSVNWPKATQDVSSSGASATSTFTFSLFDALKTNYWDGADVSICTQCPCQPPGNSAWWHGTSGEGGVVDGSVTYPLTDGFGLNGCVEITSSAASGLNLIPTFCYWGYPLSGGMLGSTVTDGCLVESLAEANNAGLDCALDPATRSYFVGATVFDCLGNPALNVALTMTPPPDQAAVSFSGVAVGNLGQQKTDPNGIAGFINVLPPASVPEAGSTGLGIVKLTATPMIGDAAASTPSSRVNVAVQAGTATEVLMYPGPPGPE